MTDRTRTTRRTRRRLLPFTLLLLVLAARPAARAAATGAAGDGVGESTLTSAAPDKSAASAIPDETVPGAELGATASSTVAGERGASAVAGGERAPGAATGGSTASAALGGSVAASPVAGAASTEPGEPATSAAAAGAGTAASTPTTAAAATATASAPPGAATAPPTPPPTVPPDGEALARAFRRSGIAPAVESGGRGAAALIPFGHVRPVLRCAPLRACAVELEPGELVLATSLGDAERWLVQAAAAGPGARTPLIVVKPTACDLSTNLVVSTDRRIYELALDSPPCRDADSGQGSYNPHLPYTGLVRFYYPDELVRRWESEEQLARQRLADEQAGRTPLARDAGLAHLNFDYAWDRGRPWPWVPAQVFDDGAHTYLVLPAAAHLAELPILLAVEPGGALALLTYRLMGQTLVADRVLEHAVLVVGHGHPKDEQRLDVRNRAFGRPGGR